MLCSAVSGQCGRRRNVARTFRTQTDAHSNRTCRVTSKTNVAHACPPRTRDPSPRASPRHRLPSRVRVSSDEKPTYACAKYFRGKHLRPRPQPTGARPPQPRARRRRHALIGGACDSRDAQPHIVTRRAARVSQRPDIMVTIAAPLAPLCFRLSLGTGRPPLLPKLAEPAPSFLPPCIYIIPCATATLC